MKKLSVFLIAALIFLFSTKSYASTDYTNSEYGEMVYNLVIESYNVSISSSTYYDYIGNYVNTSNDSSNYHIVTWQSGRWTTAFCGEIVDITTTSVQHAGGVVVAYNGSDFNQQTVSPTSATGLTNVIDHGFVSDLMGGSIDFDTIYYNPIIPVPNYSVKNNIHLNDYSVDYTMLVSDQSLSIDGHELYIMSMIYFYVPENVYINYDSYSPSNYQKGGPFYIADYEDLELVNYQSYDLDNRFHSDYQSYYESIANNRNVSSPSSMSAGTLLQRTNQFVSDSAKGIPYMGNGLEVWARYFYIDDGVIYAGDWKKWNSYRYREYERIVSEEENAPSKGISQTINQNDPNTEGDTYDPIGVQTGNVNQTVNVNTSVPNYPDYPTIASFNKDNALVQVIDAAEYMANPNNGFFGQFGGFLSAIFGFIPDSVWFIIGTGFSVSIFVMFLKIL